MTLAGATVLCAWLRRSRMAALQAVLRLQLALQQRAARQLACVVSKTARGGGLRHPRQKQLQGRRALVEDATRAPRRHERCGQLAGGAVIAGRPRVR